MPRDISLQHIPQRLLLRRADGIAATAANLEAVLDGAMTARALRKHAETVFCRYGHGCILFEQIQIEKAT
jgi:hypothetical protein